jgi:hypothetical protein
MKSFSLLLLLAAMAVDPNIRAAESRREKAPADDVNIIPQLEHEIAADKSSLEKQLTNNEELRHKLLFADAAPVAALALKALENNPGPNVALLLTSRYYLDKSKARFLKPADRKALHTRWLSTLQDADKFMEPLLKDSDRDETLKHAFEELDQSIAQAALEAGELDKAKTKSELVLRNNTNKSDWNYGNLLHTAHSILGRAALKEGDKAAARTHLVAAGRTPGSPQLNSFGPEFTFAREMLEAGEKEAVLEYLDLVGKFWGVVNPTLANNPNSVKVAERNSAQLKNWKEEIAAGRIPKDPQWK